MSAGQLMVGGVLSVTVMVCTAVAMLPEASVALKVRVITRGLAAVPAPVLASVTVTTGAPQLSSASGAPSTLSLTILPQDAPALPVVSFTSAGAVMVGAVVSFDVTWTTCEQETWRL